MNKKLVKTDVFYYSRKKLVFYLLFNLGLLSLALFFTWVIFPQYELIYSFALATCALSVLAIVIAMIIRHPLAVISSSSIKIDFCAPLKWKDIKRAHKAVFGPKELIIFEVKNLSKIQNFRLFPFPYTQWTSAMRKPLKRLLSNMCVLISAGDVPTNH